MTATVIYPAAFAKALHAASKKDEFAAVCGAKNTERDAVLIAEMCDPKKPLLPGYKWCEKCVAKLARRKK